MLIPFLILAATLPTAPPPPAELSTIVIPIRTSLAPLLPQLESQVPKSMEKLDAYELDPQKQFGMKYRVVARSDRAQRHRQRHPRDDHRPLFAGGLPQDAEAVHAARS